MLLCVFLASWARNKWVLIFCIQAIEGITQKKKRRKWTVVQLHFLFSSLKDFRNIFKVTGMSPVGLTWPPSFPMTWIQRRFDYQFSRSGRREASHPTTASPARCPADGGQSTSARASSSSLSKLVTRKNDWKAMQIRWLEKSHQEAIGKGSIDEVKV